MEKCRLIVEDLKVGTARKSHDKTSACHSMSWEAPSGSITLLTGSHSEHLKAVLRTLAGLERPLSGRIILEDPIRSVEPGRSGSKIAWLPAPGEEVFVGATVAEELAFPHASLSPDEPLIDEPGSFSLARFGDILKRSVWDLGASERRLLLLAAQARRNPFLWLCLEPLAYLDGATGRVVMNSLRERAKSGEIVVVAAEDPELLAASADSLVVFHNDCRLSGMYALNGDILSPAWLEGIDNLPLYLAAFRTAEGDPFDKIIEGLNEIQLSATKRERMA